MRRGGLTGGGCYLGDDRAGHGGPQQIFPLIDGTSSQARIDEVSHKFLLQVLHHKLARTTRFGLRFQAFQFQVTLKEVMQLKEKSIGN